MQLYDKDLLSVQEVRELVDKSKKAQIELMDKSQQEVDSIVKIMVDASVRNAERLAKMANEETGFGIYSDKVIKNIFASQGLYEKIKDMKTVGVIAKDEANKVMDVAIPVGVVAALIPSTNPTSTVMFKSIISIKSGNSVIFSPHPNAKDCILETVSVIRQAISEAGANPDLVSMITIPTAQATESLMKHPDTSMILATGGSAMVRAAYSSGTPAIGVGPGNSPTYIERSADISLAVRRIIDSKTFDNGTICASEQSIIVEKDMHDAVRAEMQKQGALFLNKDDADKLGKFILRANGTMNPMIVGKSPQVIGKLAGLDVPADVKVIVCYETGVGRGHPYSNEKLCPILGFYVEDSYQSVCDRCVEILRYEGVGHTFSMHSNNQDIIDYFVKRIPVSRFLINTASALGGVGATTALMPSYTLGCGAAGGSATSDNVGPMNLINIKKVAFGLTELSTIKSSINIGANTSHDAPNITEDLISDIVAKIVERIKNT